MVEKSLSSSSIDWSWLVTSDFVTVMFLVFLKLWKWIKVLDPPNAVACGLKK